MDDSLTDEEAVASLDQIDVWVASPPAPKEVWSLAEAVRWAATQPSSTNVRLFRPPGGAGRVAWIGSEQLRRIARDLDWKTTATAGS